VPQFGGLVEPVALGPHRRNPVGSMAAITRAIFLLAFLGCGGDGDPDPHEVVECDWTSLAPCELGCELQPTGGVDANSDGNDDTCRFGSAAAMCPVASTTTWNGMRGCCGLSSVDGQTVMAFHVCE
jgi:hypothetical protein